mmetsp:Transcript_11154/g.24148  ORF Transcript_11154/g.24148 Transcript_11154/m.24148 type:complete len:92 (+) Transcript_11154:628-903(+)
MSSGSLSSPPTASRGTLPPPRIRPVASRLVYALLAVEGTNDVTQLGAENDTATRRDVRTSVLLRVVAADTKGVEDKGWLISLSTEYYLLDY